MVLPPKLSIITVNYNNADGLEKTILSVRNQSLEGIEHIVIDAGSTDGSLQVIEKYKDSIGLWISEPDKGVYDGMNKGVLRAQGTFVQFLNSGDIFHRKTSLKEAFLTDFEGDIISFDVNYINPMNHQSKVVIFPEKIGILELNRYPIHHQGSFIRREKLISFGLFDIRYRIAADYDFFVKCLKSKQCKHEKRSLVLVDFEIGGLSSLEKMQPVIRKERLLIKRKYFSKLELLAVAIVAFYRRLVPYRIEGEV